MHGSKRYIVVSNRLVRRRPRFIDKRRLSWFGREGINTTVIFVYRRARAVRSRLRSLLLRDYKEF
jgi:hypothetical protein